MGSFIKITLGVIAAIVAAPFVIWALVFLVSVTLKVSWEIFTWVF